LVSIGGTAVEDVSPTLVFDTDGTASGNGGCNTFSGSYTLDASTIAFGAIVSTKMACAGPGSEVETAYLAALQSATSWSIAADGTLHLDGAASLVFSPA
jgi:putative lipoprotein